MLSKNDCGQIRGFCYGWTGSQKEIERDMGYAQRLRLNSTRIWLSYREYFKDSEGYIAKLRNFIRTAHKFGITTMPILFNGNMIDISILDEKWRKTGEEFAKAVVGALKDEEGIIMWDIMNEPTANDYCAKNQDAEERRRRLDTLWSFLRHFCVFVKTLDEKTPLTIGHNFTEDVEPTADCVDILSFHDYKGTKKLINETYDDAERISEETGKPILNSELCCLCRGNPYDLALQICSERNMGWYLFELLVHGYWGDVHGIVYPDGTVRDPSIVAAVMGFYRNRDPKTVIKPYANKEGLAAKALKDMEAAMNEETKNFLHKKADVNEILEAAEYIINYLEPCELVPMFNPPSLQLNKYRMQENPDLDEIKEWAYELALILKRHMKVL